MTLSWKGRLKTLARPTIRGLRPPPPLPSKPLSTKWGSERGTPIARLYLDQFMNEHRADITGAVLEVKDRRYTTPLGRNLEKSDVLDIESSNPIATVIADLSAADQVPSNHFDCFILTETLQYIYDTAAAVGHAFRILKPGGILLATMPSITPVDRDLADTDYWRFTEASSKRLFGNQFGPSQVEVSTYGNFGSCLAWLTGLAAEEMDAATLESKSQLFSQSICVRAVKPLTE